MNIAVHPSPLGPLTLVSNETSLIGCYFPNRAAPQRLYVDKVADAREDDPVLRLARLQLNEYFAGTLTEFSVPIEARGTEFQQRVWLALRAIRFGDTVSYGYIAKQIGKPAAARAVGAANAQNPVCIFIPCHRVIGTDGSLTGFAGGQASKSYLLNLERQNVRRTDCSAMMS